MSTQGYCATSPLTYHLHNMLMRIADIKRKAKERPEGYLEDVLAHGTVRGDILVIDGPAYISLLKKYNPNGQQRVGRCCGSSTASFPPLLDQMKNAAGAASRVANNLLSGRKVMAADNIVAEREAVCAGCEFLKGNRCLKCGCRYKWKIALSTEKCPIGKW